MRYPEQLRKALESYEQECLQSRKDPNKSTVIRSLKNLPQEQMKNKYSLLMCFLQKPPREKDLEYNVLVSLCQMDQMFAQTVLRLFTAVPASVTPQILFHLDHHPYGHFLADLFIDSINAGYPIDEKNFKVVINSQYPQLLLRGLIKLYRHDISLSSEECQSLADLLDVLERVDIVVRLSKLFDDEWLERKLFIETVANNSNLEASYHAFCMMNLICPTICNHRLFSQFANHQNPVAIVDSLINVNTMINLDEENYLNLVLILVKFDSLDTFDKCVDKLFKNNIFELREFIGLLIYSSNPVLLVSFILELCASENLANRIIVSAIKQLIPDKVMSALIYLSHIFEIQNWHFYFLIKYSKNINKAIDFLTIMHEKSVIVSLEGSCIKGPSISISENILHNIFQYHLMNYLLNIAIEILKSSGEIEIALINHIASIRNLSFIANQIIELISLNVNLSRDLIDKIKNHGNSALFLKVLLVFFRKHGANIASNKLNQIYRITEINNLEWRARVISQWRIIHDPDFQNLLVSLGALYNNAQNNDMELRVSEFILKIEHITSEMDVQVVNRLLLCVDQNELNTIDEIHTHSIVNINILNTFFSHQFTTQELGLISSFLGALTGRLRVEVLVEVMSHDNLFQIIQAFLAAKRYRPRLNDQVVLLALSEIDDPISCVNELIGYRTHPGGFLSNVLNGIVLRSQDQERTPFLLDTLVNGMGLGHNGASQANLGVFSVIAAFKALANKFTSEARNNEQILRNIGFEGDIPREYQCCILLQIMSDPVYDPRQPKCFYEFAAIYRWIKEHGTNPLTRQPLHVGDLKSANILQHDIDNFVDELLKEHEKNRLTNIKSELPPIRSVLKSRNMLFSCLDDDYIIAHRADSEFLQKIYDMRHGLVLKK